MEAAHRISFAIAYGWVPAVVMHTCDNPPCINPNHLNDGTQGDNMRDAFAKARMVNFHSRHHRLTDSERESVRTLFAAGTAKKLLARTFGVDPKTIRRVISQG